MSKPARYYVNTGQVMYSQHFKIKFNSEVAHPERMRLLSELFDLPELNGHSKEDLYWYKIKHTGIVTFWSNNPDLTNDIDLWIDEKSKKNLVQSMYSS